jgi:putative ABC transport system ATP-binding protein
MKNNQTVIEGKNIIKEYPMGDAVTRVLNDISIQISQGEFVSIMGPSGSGKSTLLNLIAGIDYVDQGTISIDGVEITGLSQKELASWRAANVGFIFQFYNLIPVLTAYENVEMPLLLTGLTRRQRREHVETVLSLVNLGDRMDHYPSQLSGGQQQRVAIARAMVVDPEILVADEPTGDLDRVSAGEILSLMERTVAVFGKTIIMVTHDPRAAERAGVIRHLEKGILARDDGSGFPLRHEQ